MKRVVVAWGRFNPPTIGHKKLIDAVAKIAGQDDYFIYPTHTNKKPKDPLPSDLKVEYMKKMFPTHAPHIIYDKSVNTIIKLLQIYQLYSSLIRPSIVSDFQWRHYNQSSGINEAMSNKQGAI